MGPLLAVRLQTALHPDAERAAAHFAASEAANDGRRWVGGGGPWEEGGGNGGGGGAAAGGKYYAGQPPPVQDNPMLDILQVREWMPYSVERGCIEGGLAFFFCGAAYLHIHSHY